MNLQPIDINLIFTLVTAVFVAYNTYMTAKLHDKIANASTTTIINTTQKPPVSPPLS